MQVNITNLIRQDVRVPKSQGLLPVFEAVSNALDAIADKGGNGGTIRVTIVRHPAQLDGTPGAPKDFIIEDDGVGFDDENINSFCEAFSDRKVRIGGKGRGRFTYLKVFERARIHSTFLADSQTRIERTFDFSVNFQGKDDVKEVAGQHAVGTRLVLENMHDAFAAEIPKQHETLVRRFIWHFLPRLLSSDNINILVVDGEETNLAEHIRDELQIDITQETFSVGERDFTIDHLRLRPVGGVKHRLIMAASGREVADGFHLIKQMPILGPAPLSMEGSEDRFIYVALVQGKYLDETVDHMRLGFTKERDERPQDEAEGADLLGDPQSIGDVRAAAMKQVRAFLEPFLQEALTERASAISNYIQRDGMGYHFLKADIPDLAKDIRGIDDAAIESALHDRAYKEKRQRREEVRRLLSATPEEKADDAYFEKWSDIVGEMTDIAKSELAEYVAHRRAIIELMDDRIRAEDSGKHPKEDAIHNVIFPRGKQSGEVSHEQQNLWLIDERLAFHEHLYSDLTIKRITGGDVDSALRPDLAIFESGYASFHDGATPPANLVLVELKRAARKDVSRDDPVQSALDYVADLKKGRAVTEGKAVIDVNQNAFTTVYILADFTADFRKYLAGRDFKELPGGQAYTWFHSTESVMFIAMSYRRMIDNAAMRNRIFFRKLGIE